MDLLRAEVHCAVEEPATAPEFETDTAIVGLTEMHHNRVPDYSDLMRVLDRWTHASPSFAEFVARHRAKINAMFDRAGDREAAIDRLVELEVALLLLRKPGMSVEFEVGARTGGRSPDLLATDADAGIFAVEVKRIRDGRLEAGFAEFVDRVTDRLRAIPSALGVSLTATSKDDDGALTRIDEKSFNLLRDSARILDALEAEIRRCQRLLADEETTTWDVPDAFPRVEFEIVKVRGKANDTPTGVFVRVAPVFYRDDEWKKFADSILDKVAQLREELPNVLFIITRNDTHEHDDVLRAAHELNRVIATGDMSVLGKRCYASADQFRQLVGRLSAVAFRSPWQPINEEGLRNFVWVNEAAAFVLPIAITDHLKSADAPR